MKTLLALFLAACLVAPQLAHAQNAVPPGDIKYKPEERFKVPVNKATGLSGATNVVIKEVSFDSLPEFVKKQGELIARDCTSDVDNKKLIKFYRYTSDMTRDNGLSANYLADLNGLSGKPQRTCIIGNACSEGECFLIGYNSFAYDQWGQHFTIRNKGWKTKLVEDQKTKAELTVFSIDSKLLCQSEPREGDDADKTCNDEYIWLGSGFVQFRQAPPGDAPAPAEPAEGAAADEPPNAAPAPAPETAPANE